MDTRKILGGLTVAYCSLATINVVRGMSREYEKFLEDTRSVTGGTWKEGLTKILVPCTARTLKAALYGFATAPFAYFNDIRRAVKSDQDPQASNSSQHRPGK